jgi:Zn-dependent protease/CBS domain-containing protein
MAVPLLPPLKEADRQIPSPPARPAGWAGIPLGRVFGLDLRVDGSWLILFALVTLSMSGYYSQQFPNLTLVPAWGMALATALAFFVCLLLHEISHCLVARAKGLQVRGITLFMFGGVSELRQEPRRPSDEFLIAVVGPAASVLLGFLFFGIRALLPEGSLSGTAMGWLGKINLVLAIFNLLPGFPLDGGRIVRAAAWGMTKDFRRATRIASLMGSAIAFGLIGWGIVTVFWSGRVVEGLWFGLIGWFLLAASRQSVGQMKLRDSLRRFRVEQATRATCPRVAAHLKVDEFVDEYVLRRGGRFFFVTDDETLLGLVTLDDLRRLPRDKWPRTTLGEVMVPLSPRASVAPTDSLLIAFERMNETSLDELPVRDGDRVLGVITRDDLTRLAARFLELTRRRPAG